MSATTPASENTNAASKRASALRLTTSMNVATHNDGAVSTELVAHSRNRKSPTQLVGRPSRSVSIGQSARPNTTTLATSACVGVIMRSSPGFGFGSRLGKNDSMIFTMGAVPLNVVAQARRADDVRYRTEAPSRRYLKQPG